MNSKNTNSVTNVRDNKNNNNRDYKTITNHDDNNSYNKN